MFTNIGLTERLAKAWGQPEDKFYATTDFQGHDQEGNALRAHSIAALDTLSAEAYRKFCSACHVGYERNWGYRAQHASGCAACHFLRNEEGTYEGHDPTIQGKKAMPQPTKWTPFPKTKPAFVATTVPVELPLPTRALLTAITPSFQPFRVFLGRG